MDRVATLSTCSLILGGAWLGFTAIADERDPSLQVTKGQEMALVQRIFKKITANAQPTSEADMKLYRNTIPGEQVSYSMVPIKGGEFIMGSPNTEAGHKPDESPQPKVKVEPFWIGQREVTGK